jgi:calcineurin-like phosphoesterase family protein
MSRGTSDITKVRYTNNPKTYFISDLHFGHDNLNKALRCMTTEYADELIISNWNSVVRHSNDKVYVVGDITMEKHNKLESYLSRLNGEIIVIGGNHDNKKCCNELKNLGITVMGCLEYKGYVVTHIPIRSFNASEYRGNIHGHIHAYELPSPKYINITADLNGYTPRDLDYIINKQNNKKRLSTMIYLTYKLLRYRVRRLIRRLVK